MSERPRYRLIYWVYIAIMIPALLAFGYHLANFALGNTKFPADSSLDYVVKLVMASIISPATVFVGLWCLRRAPGNHVGAILVLWGVGIIDLVRLDPSPVGSAFSSIYAGIRWNALFSLIVYFPDGKVVPLRFQKWIDVVVIIGMAAAVPAGLGVSFAPGRDAVNPLFIPAFEPTVRVFQFINNLMLGVSGMGFGIISQIIRYRTTDSHQKQQVKTLLLFVLPMIVFLPIQLLTDTFAPQYSRLVNLISGTSIQLWFMAFPLIAVGNAILRHRLYDIDIIIRRTLVYSVLTTILAVVYFGGIIVTQQLFRAATGETSDLAVVVSTLLIAALFTPVRRRVQDTIDRRLYRRKYDVEQTLAAFQRNLRDEVDMETLKANLINVVSETMQPDKIALWISHPHQRANRP